MTVYVEGGGCWKKTADDCRRGFSLLFEKVVAEGNRPKVVACGDRASAYRDFHAGVRQRKAGFLMLLVDSEDAVGPVVAPWAHLQQRDGWTRPEGAQDDQAHLMVQCMESWFLADRDALARYYGQEFLVNSLPGDADVERIPKRDVQQSLAHASAPTLKGPYHKSHHGFELLALINPVRIRQASSHAQRLFNMLETKAREAG